MSRYYPKLIGERIFLSPLCADDLEQYTKWLNDRRVTDNLGNSSLLLGEEKERDYLTDATRSGYNFAIVRQEDQRLLGNISFFDLQQVSRTAQCGLFIGDAETRGRGYGAEALYLLLEYGFNVLNLHNVMLKVFAFNEPAVGCYRRVGFRECGRRREAYFLNGRFHDELFMDLLADEFRAVPYPTARSGEVGP